MACCPPLPDIEIHFTWQTRIRYHFIGFSELEWNAWSGWNEGVPTDSSALLGHEHAQPDFGAFTRDVVSPEGGGYPAQQEMRFYLRFQPSPTCYLKVSAILLWETAEGVIDHQERLDDIIWERHGTRDRPCYPEGFKTDDKTTWPTAPEHGDGSQEENWIYVRAPDERNFIHVRQILWTVAMGK